MAQKPLEDLTDEELDARIAQLQASGGAVPAAPTDKPSTFTDAAKATLPALERTAVGVGTIPNTVGKLVSQGINAAGDYAFPDWKSSPPGRVMSAAEKHFEPGSYSGVQKRIEDATGPLYSAQTPGGKIWEGAVGAAPLGMIGEGAMIPNMVRALASGGASEAAGQATEGTAWETPARIAAGAGTYGLTGAAQTPRIIADTPVRAAAQGLENAGVRVPASALANRGGRLMATLEGGPQDLSGPVSDAMQRQGGVVRPSGNTDQFNRLVEQRGRDVGTQADQLGANTSIPAPAIPPLRGQLANSVATHVGRYGGTSLERPEVTQGLQDFDQLTLGNQPLTGTQYQGLHQQWNGLGIPEMRTMAGHLDAAMDTAHPGAWNDWRDNFANYKGIQAASEPMGGAATVAPLSPDKVVNAMYRRTPMRDTAENAQTVQAAQPAPYDFTKSGKVLAGLGAGLGGAAGAYHGGVPGAGEAGLLGLFGLPAIAQALPAAVGPIFRSAGGQNLLRNLDPRVVSALLAQQGVRPKGGAGEQPQNTAQ